MTLEEIQLINTLTANMTTRCIGRYLIDLPESFVLSNESSTEIEGVKISVEPTKKSLFNSALEAREMQLKKERIAGETTPSLLYKKELPDAEGLIFNRSRTGESAVLRTLELLAYKDGYSFKLLIDTRDMSFSETAQTDTRRTDTPEKFTHLLEIYSRISGRIDTKIPTEQGVCFANGFLKGPPSDQEVLITRHHLDKFQDVSTAFHSMSDIKEETELLDRGNSIENSLKEKEGHTLRKGKALAQIANAQEWLMSMKSSESGLMWHHLTLEANAKTGSASTPFLVFDFDIGIKNPSPSPSLEEAAALKPLTNTSLNEEQSIAIWDKITTTLRPRPGAF